MPDNNNDRSGRYIHIPSALIEDTSLSGAEKLVLISLLNHYNYEKKCAWPCQQTIMAECGLSKNTVIRTIKNLENKGYIATQNYLHRSGKHNIYYINSQSFSQNNPAAPIPQNDISKNKIDMSESNSESATVGLSKSHRETLKVPHRDFESATQRLSKSHRETLKVPQRDLNINIEHYKEQYKEQRDIKPCSTEITDAVENAEKNSNVNLEKEFDCLWDIYPKKEEKTAAFNIYCTERNKGTPFEEIKKSLEGYLAKQKAQNTPLRYIKSLPNFLRNSCWKDYLNASASSAGYGGFAEPTSGDKFKKEHELIKNHFGGDTNAYASWLLDNKPEPIDKWYADYRNRRERG